MQGEILKFAIKRSKMSVEAAALKLKIHRVTLSNYFRQMTLDADVLMKLKDKLGIDMHEEERIYTSLMNAPKKRIDYSLVEDTGGEKYLSNQDIADMLRKVDSKTDVILSALSVLVSRVSGESEEKELRKLQALVNKRLKA